MSAKTQTPEELQAYKLKVLAASAESILRDLDGLLMGAYNLYDVGRAIPHPYSAVGDMANGYLHDFKSTAYKIERYIELVKAEIPMTETAPEVTP